MRNRFLQCLAVVLVTSSASNLILGEVFVYRPLRSWVDPQQEAFSKWNGLVAAKSLVAVERPIVVEDRPQLPGYRPRNVELLEDSLLRKFTSKVKSSEVARQHILRLSQNQAGRNVLNGAMHEAMYVNRNPDYGYVRRPNSPQNDLYSWQAGRRTPIGAQLKFHVNGRPTDYARDMQRD